MSGEPVICNVVYRLGVQIHCDTNIDPARAIKQTPIFKDRIMSAERLLGSCHCGTVQFEVRTQVTQATRCNCSLCRRKGAAMSPAFDAADLQVTSGADALVLYQFNTQVAKHYFCKHCGIYPFHQTRKDPNLWRVNLGCLEGVDVYALETSVSDGASLSVVEDA